MAYTSHGVVVMEPCVTVTGNVGLSHPGNHVPVQPYFCSEAAASSAGQPLCIQKLCVSVLAPTTKANPTSCVARSSWFCVL